MYVTNTKKTGYWLSHNKQPITNQSYSSLLSKNSKKSKKIGSKLQGTITKSTSTSPSFSIDFFSSYSKASQIITILDRVISIATPRPRWLDISLTRGELAKRQKGNRSVRSVFRCRQCTHVRQHHGLRQNEGRVWLAGGIR